MTVRFAERSGGGPDGGNDDWYEEGEERIEKGKKELTKLVCRPCDFSVEEKCRRVLRERKGYPKLIMYSERRTNGRNKIMWPRRPVDFSK